MSSIKIRKVGNSLGLILPKEVIERLNLKEGDSLQILEERNYKTHLLKKYKQCRPV